jgi:rubrerythrin
MSTSATPSHETTLKNLKAAFNGESNANAKYTAFAKKADEEGYHHAASLFRAAARAEQIHAANHAAVIKKLGGTPEAKIEQVELKTTAENLKCAIAGEEYEATVMYPEFIKEAEEKKNSPALRTFRFAIEAEKGHAQMYRDALANLEQMKTKTAYYVCPTCGYTVEKAAFERCPVCGHPKEKFEVVE